MKDIIEKLSSYHILNYMLPGALFVSIGEQISTFNIIHNDIIVVNLFLFYFIGLIISRIGSLLIEPILRKIKFLKFAQYEEYVKSMKNDSKLEILSEVNNMYRSLCSMLIVLLVLIGYEYICNRIRFVQANNKYILIVLLLILFLFSYRKQTIFIKDRVLINTKEKK